MALDMPNPGDKLKLVKRIADPVHGLIRLTEIESKVLEHPAFQRLRDVTQLGMAKNVYPGAMHNRFSHSLGVLHNATQMYNALYENWHRLPHLSGDIEADWIFSDFLLQATRLAAMVHDIGHFPFSHNLEPAFGWFKKKGLAKKTFRHEHLGRVIVEQILDPILGDYTSYITDFITGGIRTRNTLIPSFIISSATDADRMDYLVRDAIHCGVDHGRFDRERLLDSLLPYRTRIGGKSADVLVVRSKGIEAVEQFLLARHRMHQTIYFNPSVVGFEAGIRRAYYQISTDNPPWKLPEFYLDHPEKILEIDEGILYHQFKQELRKRNSWLYDTIIKRMPLNKKGPYYHTVISGKEKKPEEVKKFQILKQIEELENPVEDWYQQENWMYVEKKTQTLVDSLPRAFTRDDDRFSDAKKLKNVILLINSSGEIIDPTSAVYGHTFLPYIASNTYYRYIIFSHKKEKEKLDKLITPLSKQFKSM